MQGEGYKGKQREPCKRCGGEKPPGERRRLCDACKVIADGERREKDRQRARRAEWLRERRAVDRDFVAESDRRAREWRKANAERHAEGSARRRKQWRAANPERARELWQRYQARKLAAFVEDVNPLVVLERHDGICGICGDDVDPLRFDVDHIVPLARGGEHSYRNTQPAHPSCNYRKGAKAP
jgi:5-methylcytosine-specific restriction endonuclease McrA